MEHSHSHSHADAPNGHTHSHDHAPTHDHAHGTHTRSHSQADLPASPGLPTPSPRSHTRTSSYTPSHRPRSSIYSPRTNGYAFPSAAPSPALPYTPRTPRTPKLEPFAAPPPAAPPLAALHSLTTPLLLTTTLVLASLAYRPPAAAALPTPLLSAAALASVTLLAAGVLGTLAPEIARRRRVDRVALSETLWRAAVVWASYYAAFEIGGVRAAAIVACMLAAGVNVAGVRGLAGRRATVAVVALGLVWDLWVGKGLPAVVAYVLLCAGMVGVRRSWPVEGGGSASLVGGLVMGGVAALGWVGGVQMRGLDGYGVGSGMLGGAAMVFGRGVPGTWECAVTMVLGLALGWGTGEISLVELMSEMGLSGLTVAAVHFDTQTLVCEDLHGDKLHDHGHSHDAHDHGHSHAPAYSPPSAVSALLLTLTESHPLLHSILLDKSSRRISYFMLLNFAFMLVQTTWGFLTGSLGLISDSIHMFFDCLALAVGVAAQVLSKRPPSARYPYGLGKMDTLAGFANGILLMLISVEIIWEAVERLRNPAEMSRLGELFFVSAAGLAVNMVGIFAFDHAHSHGGHSHGHSHGDGGHGDGDNMHGIFLHILADALGSVSVVVSTALIHYTSWPGWDPLASVLIALLIFVSSVPLVKSAARGLLLTVGPGMEYELRETIAGIGALPGVREYRATRFWETGDGGVRGVVHVIADGDREGVRRRVEDWVKGQLGARVGSVDLTVVVEGGEGACWCRQENGKDRK